MIIRDEDADDAAAIEALTRAAFAQAEHADGTEHLIIRRLRAAGALTLSLVAADEAALLGHVAVSPVSLSDGRPGWHGLGPISVRPSRQGRGIGAALMQAALARLRHQGAAGCVLLGDPAYYGRFGFTADPKLVLRGVPPAYFQALSLDGSRPRAQVTYHPAFSA